MPAPRADAQQVPMEQDGQGETPEQQSQVTGDYTAAGSSGANEALPHTIIVPGQARARGDEEIDDPHPGSLLQSWCVTALASLGRRRKRVQEQQVTEQVTRVTGSEERELDRRSTRDSDERGSMTSEHASQFDATGTSHSNKISSQEEPPSGKRVRIALSPTRRVIADDAPDDPVLGPVISQETVPSAPVVVPAVTPPPPNPSPHDHTPSHAGSSDRDGGSHMYDCPLCTWRFHNANRRYLHLGLQHSVLVPKLGGKTQDNPDGSKLYMIPVLSAVRGHNGCTQWASEKIKHAYQTVVRNALYVSKSDWPRISNKRWGSRDDERFVPPKNVPPSHMDMPEQEQLAMFEGDNAIRLLATGQVIYHDIPASHHVADRSQERSYDRSQDRSYDSYREWKADSWSTDTFRGGEWHPTHHGRWDREWSSNSWEREGDSHRRSQSQSQFNRGWNQEEEQRQRRSHSTTGNLNRPREPVPSRNDSVVSEQEVPSAGQAGNAAIDTDMVLAMQTQSQVHSNAQVLDGPPPVPVPSPVSQSQSAIIADVFDKHFKNIDDMSTQQVMDKLIELHAILDIDVFYKVAAIFEKEPGEFPPHRQAVEVEEGQPIVQVQNKMLEPVTSTGSASSGDRPKMKPPPQRKADSVTSPVTEVPKYKGSTVVVESKPAVVTQKKPPPQLPKSEVKPPTGPPPPPVQSKAVKLQVPEENQQTIPVTPVTAPENAEEGENVIMTTPQIRGPQTSMLQAHTLSAVTEGSPPPAEVIVESIRTSQVGPVPSSIANLAIIPPDVDQYVKAPRTWPVTEVTGPEFPGTSVTTVLEESEWNLTQFPDLPLQAARVQGTIMQQLMNLATNQNARMAALEQLVTNQYNILASSPGSQLMEGTIPALINSSLEAKATLERLSKEFNEREEFKNRQPYSAVEAFENLTSQQESLQKRQQEMVRSMSSMVEKIKELQQNQQLLQKSNADLTRTSQYLREAIKSHETSLLHVQTELNKVTDRSDSQEKTIKMLVSRAEHDRACHKKDMDQVNKILSNLFAVVAKLDVNTEDIVIREVARDERSMGFITDMNNRMTIAESSMYGLTPVVRALCEHNLPDIVRRLRPLAPVDHEYWGLIVPTNGEPTIRQVAQALVPPQFPEGGVAVAFAVPTDQTVQAVPKAVPAVPSVTAVPAEEAQGTGDTPPDA